MASKKPHNTSWGGVADWYNDHLGKENTYHSEVILPNLLRLLDIQKGDRVLDLACGQGFFTREIAKRGAHTTGVDIAPELIAQARIQVPNATFHVSSATDLSFIDTHTFDSAICILALQNIEDITSVFKEVRRVMQPGGRFIMVLNHPTFRIPKRSSWEWDEEKNVQYRRVDGYLSGAKMSIDMHPGSTKKQHTISYHRSLQDFFKALTKSGWAVTRLEEWISHKTSEKGPRQKAEDTARKEIPLFMMLEGRC